MTEEMQDIAVEGAAFAKRFLMTSVSFQRTRSPASRVRVTVRLKIKSTNT